MTLLAEAIADYNQTLANMVHAAKPGTCVDDIWSEFMARVKPPQEYIDHLDNQLKDELTNKQEGV